ncbi:S-methyl-5-thioribose-1-phosphate isomerase [Marinobacter nanhaiticus D15-8W]|uniref:Methylthioribose-1-phosphate isomerase n=1 Tax=Marinobacter nanhaiticus D15-8W TaxID=626887 RepID=N6W080_9GAMM|nr:S-methyl-5-thioribose-1-phosphate isomerase [Marinobacter nanhaiticus]ENO13534.1 S-methyl-5-thioribose-1-phosphate isomerase [Marinobacter nanhaiticus D15-8W]BES70903.1 S-methyl-5-thioribose-1-phosphate isomerase [Marinobacter nanhaiticus D15-8W]
MTENCVPNPDSNHLGTLAIIWHGDHLALLDQRQLPDQEIWLTYKDASAVADAIRDMVVRGAPAIGISAAYGVVLAAHQAGDTKDWRADIEVAIEVLAKSRPTAVNLFWALERMKTRLQACQSAAEAIAKLTGEAESIHAEDVAANRLMGRHALSVMGDEPMAVLTHCNTGALATGGYGTALGVVRSLWHANRLKRVYADETRPWLQGSRLTAWELQQEGIPVTLNADSAAAQILRQGDVRWVIVGADRITANGDVANKIGTYNLAILARHHGVRFMVVAPSSTVDMALASGEDIPIEERDGTEVRAVRGVSIAPDGVDVFNPVFDVTPAELVDAIVTEKGVIERPDRDAMQAMFATRD